MAQEFRWAYYTDAAKPYTIGLTLLDDLPVTSPTVPPYDFDAATAGDFANTYQLASGVAQAFGTIQQTGVIWKPAGLRVLDSLDPDVVISVGTQELTPFTTGGFEAGGVDNQVAGLQCRSTGSRAFSALAVGLLREEVTPFKNQIAIPISGDFIIAGINKLRQYLNGTSDRVTASGSGAVARHWVQLSKFESVLYHSVRRA